MTDEGILLKGALSAARQSSETSAELEELFSSSMRACLDADDTLGNAFREGLTTLLRTVVRMPLLLSTVLREADEMRRAVVALHDAWEAPRPASCSSGLQSDREDFLSRVALTGVQEWSSVVQRLDEGLFRSHITDEATAAVLRALVQKFLRESRSLALIFGYACMRLAVCLRALAERRARLRSRDKKLLRETLASTLRRGFVMSALEAPQRRSLETAWRMTGSKPPLR
jgi:hypothetical protein